MPSASFSASLHYPPIPAGTVLKCRFCQIVGGVNSPLLSNIYLDKLDRFMEDILLPMYNRGDRRKNNPEYKALLTAARHAGDKGNHDGAARLRKQAQRMPSRDPDDPEFRRLWYV